MMSLPLLLSLVLYCPVDGEGLPAELPDGPIPVLDLDLADANIRDALHMVAHQVGANLILAEGVQGQVTARLSGCSLDAALNALCSSMNLSYEIQDDIISVRPRVDDTTAEAGASAEALALAQAPRVEVFHLRFVDAERLRPVLEPLLSPEGSISVLQTADHIAQANQERSLDQQFGQQGPTTGENDVRIGTRLASTSQGQPAKSHTLVVEDTPERLERVEAVIAELDHQPSQMVIEARFVEMIVEQGRQLGVDWNVVARATGSGAPHTFPFGDSSLGTFGPDRAGGGRGFPDAPDSVSVPGSAGLFTFGTLDLTSLSAVLRLIQRESGIEVVSCPRVVVDDRHTATILVGERYPIFSANVSDFGTVTEQLDHYEPIGVQLEVTPSLKGHNEIELFVRPSTSSLGSDVVGSTGLAVARINSRQVDTAVTVRDGQTVVLGGLYTTRAVEQETRVPLLGSIPVLGNLFRSSNTSSERVDLMVFLTVRLNRDPILSQREQAILDRTEREPTERMDLGLVLPPPAY